MISTADVAQLPRALSTYGDQPDASLIQLLLDRVRIEPFNAVATGIFILAIAHTFATARFTKQAYRAQDAHDARSQLRGRPTRPSVLSGLLHFLGEVEVVFGLWAIVLLVAFVGYGGWDQATHYFSDSVNYTEPIFVVVIMALASTRPIVLFAERALAYIARIGRSTPASWWVTILIVGPILGSFITEPAAMTISALLLARQFFDLRPSTHLKYATLGLLFVNVSIGGTLTHFAAPPVLMVARPWDWGTWFVFSHLGWRALLAILAATLVYFLWFRRELADLASHASVQDIDEPDDQRRDSSGLFPVPAWLTGAHIGFMAWTVGTAHHPALFVGGFLIFLGLTRATAAYQSRVDLRAPMLVGFFLAGLVIHGGLQAWWIAPVLARLTEMPLFLSSTLLTAFNDNALITYLATLVPGLTASLKVAVVQGAVTGGGLTVIANAPNPAGQALLSRFFDGAIAPVGLLVAALVPTFLAIVAFRLL